MFAFTELHSVEAEWMFAFTELHSVEAEWIFASTEWNSDTTDRDGRCHGHWSVQVSPPPPVRA
jgi:hypothetical protein